MRKYDSNRDAFYVGDCLDDFPVKELRKRIRCIMLLADIDREHGVMIYNQTVDVWILVKPPGPTYMHYHVHEKWDEDTLVHEGIGTWLTSEQAAQEGCVLESCDMCKQIAAKRYGFCEKHHHST